MAGVGKEGRPGLACAPIYEGFKIKIKKVLIE
jgi:hypothetical protein